MKNLGHFQDTVGYKHIVCALYLERCHSMMPEYDYAVQLSESTAGVS